MFKWQNPRTGTVHANELLEPEALCGQSLHLMERELTFQPVDPDTAITCLNCKQVLMTPAEREQRREFQKEHALRLAAGW